MKRIIPILVSFLFGGLIFTALGKSDKPFVDLFEVDKAELSSSGTNQYFSLNPGFQLILEGKEKDKTTVVMITVLNKVKVVDGVETRIVEEKETVNKQLVEMSFNYFAISKRTNDVFYFGEDVDIYKKGKPVSHEGAWLSGVAGARFGMMMPGTPVMGMRYCQEIAPKVAMDRAEIIGVNEALTTSAGKFEKCLRIEETSPLETSKGRKLYAPGIGLVQDGDLKLVDHAQYKLLDR